MSEETVVARKSSTRTWIIRGVLWSIVIFVITILSSCTLILEAPIHFLFGWVFHAVKTLPPLLANWRMVLFPAGCLLLAGVLIHRFVGRWFKAKERPQPWRPFFTVASLALLMLGCAAAITLSGALHQFIWLMGDPWIENRGRRMEQTLAVNNARQLVMGLFEYHQKHGHYPNSLLELKSELDFPARLFLVPVDYSRVSEPFILLNPGGTRAVNPDEPLIVSPVIINVGKIVVGYGDGSVTSLPAKSLNRVIQGESRSKIQQQPPR